MRSRPDRTIDIRGRKLGGEKPLFCIPLVAHDPAELAAQAEFARTLKPDLVEWRADYNKDLTAPALIAAARTLRATVPGEAIIFTLRIKGEGGAQPMHQGARKMSIEAVLKSKLIDMVDLELSNEPEILDPLMHIAAQHSIPVMLAYHNFENTPPNEELMAKILAMQSKGADVAKIAVMPNHPDDVLRLLKLMIEARTRLPELPLAIMAMGAMGSISRVAGFLYGSDMAYAVGKEASAPGQIPIEDARNMASLLLRYA